jgi:hypothetical protein
MCKFRLQQEIENNKKGQAVACPFLALQLNATG